MDEGDYEVAYSKTKDCSVTAKVAGKSIRHYMYLVVGLISTNQQN